MTVHLKKLSVGSTSLDSLRSWQDVRVANGLPIIHPTRNKPRRAEEILDGGSLYWVIKESTDRPVRQSNPRPGKQTEG